jgi:hypothetical protein
MDLVEIGERAIFVGEVADGGDRATSPSIE